MEPEELRIEIPSTKFVITAKGWGLKSGIRVLCLHGWMDNANSFNFLIPFLLKSTKIPLYFLCIDLPGHASSTHRTHSSTYPVPDYVNDVMLLLDTLKWDRFILLGHSGGAGLSTVIAGTFPEKVIKLVLIEAIGYYSWTGKKYRYFKRYSDVNKDPGDAPTRLKMNWERNKLIYGKRPKQYPSLKEAIARRMTNSDMKWESAEVLVQRGTREVTDEDGNTKYEFLHDPKLHANSLYRYDENQTIAFLKRIEAPTILVMAKGTSLYDTQDETMQKIFNKRVESVRNIKLVWVEGGHHVHLDNAGIVAPIISEFLNEEIASKL